MVGSTEGLAMLKLYKDKDLKEEITLIDLGTVEAGTIKTIEIYLHNDAERVMYSNLIFEIPALGESTLEVVTAPITVPPKAILPILLRWSPSLNFKQGLKVPLKIKGDEIYLVPLS
jgi:hypothetical protein